MEYAKNIFNQYSFTGNAVIDSLILAHIIPIIISYVNTLTKAIANLLNVIWNIIISYTQSLIKTKVIGNILCVVLIDNKNQLFDFLDINIFQKRVPSDVLHPRSKILSFLTILKNLGSNDKQENHYKRWKKKCDNLMNLYVKYDHTGREILEHEKITPRYSSHSESKFFNYKDKVIIIKKIYTEENMQDKFKIKLLDFSSKNETNDKNMNVNLIEDFLRSRFGLQDKIYYNYTISAHDLQLIAVIRNLITNGNSNPKGLLKYNDENNTLGTNISSEFTSPHIKVECSCTTLNYPTQDYTKFLSIIDINNKNQNIPDNSFGYYYKKYINTKSGHNYLHIGFFFSNDKLFMLGCNTTCDIHIISFGKNLNRTDILETLDWIIKLNIKCNLMTIKSSEKKIL